MAEKRIVCFQSKKVKRCRFFFISNNYYIYLKRYFEKFVTYDFLVYSGGQLRSKQFSAKNRDTNAKIVTNSKTISTMYIWKANGFLKTTTTH